VERQNLALQEPGEYMYKLFSIVHKNFFLVPVPVELTVLRFNFTSTGTGTAK
jgi:hypothetical protein